MNNRLLWGLGVGLVGFAVARALLARRNGYKDSYNTDARRHEKLVDLTSEDSFPASDPPSYSPMQTMGGKYVS